MAKLYNQKSVANNKATTAQTITSFKYRGFSSNEIKNNFKLYDTEIFKNKNIGNVQMTENYTIPSRTIANDIYDQNDNIDLGLVQITSPSSTPIIAAPISLPINVTKSIEMK